MPLNRFVVIIACVIAASAVTVYVGLALAQTVQVPAVTGLAVLSLIALCASFGWRVFADRRNTKDDHPQ